MSRELVPAGRRELTRTHITFYRAVMDGVDIARAWEQYLTTEGEYSDSLARAMSEWVRQALIQEAMAAGKPALIGLFRREPWRVKTSTKPTLAEFAARFEDVGDWSETDLIDMWKDEYGSSDQAEARRDRLSQRLREALRLVEGAARRQPSPNDLVATWLAPNLATKLNAAGLKTLQAVRDALAARTTARWSAVSGVGEVWSDRLLQWMQDNEILPTPVAALPSPTSPLVPLERFEHPLAQVLPASPPNQPALERASPYPGNNALGASNDKHAIELWLAAKASNPNTLRAYRKNAERLLLWCYFERRITFPEMTVADCIHYRTWLSDLGRKTCEEWSQAGWRLPAEQWLLQPDLAPGMGLPVKKRRVARRDSPEWRPFEGPLKPASVAFDLLTVRALFDFMVRGHVLKVNPWDLMGKKMDSRAKLATATQQFTSRSFTMEQWKTVVDGLKVDGTELERRLLLTLWLGFGCGLRASEMLSLTLGSLEPGREIWRLNVLGKGGKMRTVPLPSPVRQALLAYLASVDVPYELVIHAALGPAEDPRAGLPILRGRRGRRRVGGPAATSPLHYSQLYDALKSHLANCAREQAAVDPIAAAQFKKASTHWLRHTCATQALKNGVALTGVQKLLGHSDLTTTSTYVTEADDILADEMEAFMTRTPTWSAQAAQRSFIQSGDGGGAVSATIPDAE